MKKYQGYDAKEVLAKRVAQRQTARVWIGQISAELIPPMFMIVPQNKGGDEK